VGQVGAGVGGGSDPRQDMLAWSGSGFRHSRELSAISAISENAPGHAHASMRVCVGGVVTGGWCCAVACGERHTLALVVRSEVGEMVGRLTAGGEQHGGGGNLGGEGGGGHALGAGGSDVVGYDVCSRRMVRAGGVDGLYFLKFVRCCVYLE
jgi:hypothetical protein